MLHEVLVISSFAFAFAFAFLLQRESKIREITEISTTAAATTKAEKEKPFKDTIYFLQTCQQSESIVFKHTE
jgi:hypothetical protein